MLLFNILGIIFLIWGGLYLFFPDTIEKLNRLTTNKMIDIAQIQRKYHRVAGTLYILLAIVFALVGFELK